MTSNSISKHNNNSTNNIYIEDINEFDVDNIDWKLLDFKNFDFGETEIEIIIENFGNLLNSKQLSYLKRKINYEGYKELTAKQRYYRNHRDEMLYESKEWQKNNREAYNKNKREYRRKKADEERLALGIEKSNRGRPRKD